METLIIRNEKELDAMRRIGRIVANVLQEMAAATVEGITTRELDQICAAALTRYGAISAPMSEYNFPGYSCISVNDEIAHGIPGERVLRPGDMVNLDVSASYAGYFADSGVTILLPPEDKVGKRLIAASKKTLENSIAQAVAGRRLSMVSKATEETAKSFGFKTIRNLCGHGVGHTLHDQPEMINNYYDPHDTRVMAEGMALAIETFVAEKENHVIEDKKNGWTLRTPKGSRAVQFEHTVIVTKGKPIILTLPGEVE